MQKCISAAGDSLWVAIVDITGGPDKLRKTQRAQGNRGLQQRFQGQMKNDQDGWSWYNANLILVCPPYFVYR